MSKLVPLPTDSLVPERDAGKMPILEARHLGIEFGGLKAVDDFNLTIGRTEIAGLIGPNGAGKTTAFNLLTKVYQPTSGTVLLDGKDTHNMNTVSINKAGIARTFQNIRLFGDLTVEDNVKIGLHNQMRYGVWNGVFRLPKYWKKEKQAHEKALDLLSIFDMQDLAGAQAGSLPYGAQRRLEIVRALATNPKLLLLDEHTAALDPKTAAKVMELTDRIVREGQLTTLMITHNMKDAIKYGNRLIMMYEGHVVVDVSGEEKKNLTVEQLLNLFSRASGSDEADDKLLLS